MLAANVNAFSPQDTPEDRAALEAELAAHGADVVLVLEKRPLELPGYVRAADNFDEDLPRASHATALYCRAGLACAGAVTPEFGSETSFMPLGLLRVTGPLAAPVCLGALHAPPPVPLGGAPPSCSDSLSWMREVPAVLEPVALPARRPREV